MPSDKVATPDLERKFPMRSITISDILTIIFVLEDDWYQAEGVKLLRGKPGKKPEFTDSEVMTLILAQDYIPYPSETHYIEFIFSSPALAKGMPYPAYYSSRNPEFICNFAMNLRFARLA
jgi:hypothetical protein